LSASTRLRSFPVELVEVDDGVLLVRGSTVVQIRGHVAHAAVRGILEACAGEGLGYDEIIEAFPDFAQAAAKALIDELIARRILVGDDQAVQPVDGQESPLDVFRWELGLTKGGAAGRLADKTIAVVGVNWITRRVCEDLAAWGVERCVVIDDDRLRNPEFFDDRANPRAAMWPSTLVRPEDGRDWLARVGNGEFGAVIVGSEHRAQELMRDVNRVCVDHRVLFMPATLSGSIGFVGPLVVPRETACYECLIARENSNLLNPESEGPLRSAVFRSRGYPGFHPAMASVLGDFAAMELIKFTTDVVPWHIGALFEINMLSPEMTTRRVLKLPRCAVCGVPEKHPGISGLARSLGVVPETYRETATHGEH
jgi:bacteriocin biosynthesis cyclodehydratase domain-containing protein